MIGIMPSNVGDVEKASKVFVRNELNPLQMQLLELNDWLGTKVINFDVYTLPSEQ